MAGNEGITVIDRAADGRPTGQALGQNPAVSLRRGWCPTGTTGMAAADGWLLRVRAERGRLRADDLRALADISRQYGNDAVLVTRRAKIELRGIADTAATIAALRQAGLLLAPGDEDSLPDRIVAPATDLDPSAAADLDSVCDRLTAALAECPATAELPAKFAIVVDGGGRAHIGSVHGDLRFDAVAAAGGAPPRIRVALGGDAATATPLGVCEPAAVPAVARTLVEAFVALRAEAGEAIRRVRDAVAERGPGYFREYFQGCFRPDCRAPLRSAPGGLQSPDGVEPRRPPPDAVGPLPGVGHGLRFPFGRIEHDALLALADYATRAGHGDVRLLPTRTLVLPGVVPEAAAALRAAGAVDCADDPRLRVEACTGLGGCPHGTTHTRADALVLAQQLPPALLADAAGCALHVSGCSKGCARSGPSRVTLTGAQGRYDVALQAVAGDTPDWLGLSVEQVLTRLQALARVIEQYRTSGEDPDQTMKRMGTARLRALAEELASA